MVGTESSVYAMESDELRGNGKNAGVKQEDERLVLV